jgi:hypothetical protein
MSNNYGRTLRHRQLSRQAWERLEQPMPGDGEVSLGTAETYAKQETEREIAARLAALEALDPSQKRPTPKPNILNNVAFIDL